MSAPPAFSPADIADMALCLERNRLNELEIEADGTRLHLVVQPRASKPVAAGPTTRPAMDAPNPGIVVSTAIGRLCRGILGPGAEPIGAGDAVSAGQILALLETGELRFPIVATADGFVDRWLVDEGAIVGFNDGVLIVRD